MQKIFRELFKIFLFPILVLILHVVISFFGFYTFFPNGDIAMHFLGGFSVAVTYFLLINFFKKNSMLGKTHWFVCFLFVISLVMLTAVFWEFFEYGLKIFFGIITQPSLKDTISDLLLGFVGGIFGFILTFLTDNNNP